jgi:hypothetical protein
MAMKCVIMLLCYYIMDLIEKPREKMNTFIRHSTTIDRNLVLNKFLLGTMYTNDIYILSISKL